ncbi:MAG: NADH:flavin oxidoreductase [Nitrospirae bacterium]|nr:MAG: NADH:flavin oxidoreductase [Nitrospirota bacterium]
MLFEPFTFAGMELRNRIVRSATYEKRADVDGFVTEELITLYRNLAKGGAGLIITGNALVHVSGRSVPQAICIHNDFYIDKLKKLTEAVHKKSGRVAIQLVHGGRQCFPSMLGTERPLAPSEVYEPTLKTTPRAMIDEEIWQIIESFGDAARRAVYAGFDGIQVHGAHGYLVNNFLSPYTNKRTDYWGGDEERRFHFLEEVFKSIRKEAGDHYPIMIKLNSADFVEGGLTVQESLKIAKRLEDMGLDAVEVSGGIYESQLKAARTGIKTVEQEAYFREAARTFKKELNIPLMLVGGIRSKTLAEDILREGDADLISLSRPLIREPDLPNKFKEGKEKADCISCNGCMRFMKLDMVRCTQLEKGAD